MSPTLAAFELTDEVMNRTGLFDFLWRQLRWNLILTEPWLPLTQSASPHAHPLSHSVSLSLSMTNRQCLRRPSSQWDHLLSVIYHKLKRWKPGCTAEIPSLTADWQTQLHIVWAGFHFISHPSCYSSKAAIIHMISLLSFAVWDETDPTWHTIVLCICTCRCCCQVWTVTFSRRWDSGVREQAERNISCIYSGNKDAAGSRWWCVLASTDTGSVGLDPVFIVWPHIPILSVQ